jgi:hypothetical protein
MDDYKHKVLMALVFIMTIAIVATLEQLISLPKKSILNSPLVFALVIIILECFQCN